jgi:hypothetical protein
MVRLRLQTVIETPEFASRARRLLAEAEKEALIDYLARNPAAGDVMKESGGARKVRWAAKGKGKSGGVRVITFYSGASVPVFLLTIFGKNEKADLTKGERNELRATLADLVSEYRKGVARNVKAR